MKIELEEPFKSKWRFGYLVTNKEPRRHVVLFNSNSDRTTISYARYLMCVKLGRFLTRDEKVDHKNENKMDDRIDNYQILNNRENIIKNVFHRNAGRRMVEFECGVCNKVFSKPRNITHLVMRNKDSDFCSRHCAGKGKRSVRSVIIREYREGPS